MSTCVDIVSNLLSQMKDIKFEDRYKGTSSDPRKITNKELIGIMNGFFNKKYSDEQLKEHWDGIESTFSQIKMSTLRKIVNGIFNKELLQEQKIEYSEDYGKDVSELLKQLNGSDPRLLSIAVHQLFGTISEVHNVVTKNIKASVREKIKDKETGMYHLNFNQYAKVIGKLLFQSYGKKPENIGDEKFIKIGTEILNKLSDAGYIKIKESSEPEYRIALSQARQEHDTDKYLGEDYEHSNTIKVKKVFMLDNNKFSPLFIKSILEPNSVKDDINKLDSLINTATIQNDFGGRTQIEYIKTDDENVKYNELSDEQKQYLQNKITLKYFSKINKIIIPQNITHMRKHSIMEDDNVDGISTEEKLKKESDMALTGIIEQAVNQIEKKAYYIDEDLLQTLTPFVRDLYDIKQKEGEFNYFTFINNSGVKEFLGLENYEVTNLTLSEIESKSGSDRTKLDNFLQMVSAFVDEIEEFEKEKEKKFDFENDTLNNEFFIGKFRGRNARTYLTEISFNPETDKHFTRKFTNVTKDGVEINLLDKNNKLTIEAAYVFTHLLHEVLDVKGSENKFIKAFIDKNLESLPEQFEEGSFEYYLFGSLSAMIGLDNKKLDINNINSIRTEIELMMANDKINTQTREKYMSKLTSIKMIQMLKFAREYNKYKETGVFKTKTAPELDANSSGIMIKIMQAHNSGSKKAEEVLYRFGTIPRKNKYIDKSTEGQPGGYLAGPYELIMEKMDNMFNLKSTKEKTTNKFDNIGNKVINLSGVQKIPEKHKRKTDKGISEISKENVLLAQQIWNEYSNKLGISKRDLAKYPTMIIGAYNMAPTAAAKENVAKPMYDDMKKLWYKNPELFQDFLNLINASFKEHKIFNNTDIKQYLNIENLTKDKLSELLVKPKVEEDIQNILKESIGNVLAYTTYNEFTAGIFEEDNDLMQETWKDLKEVYSDDKQIYKVADINLLTSNEDIDINKLEYMYDDNRFNNSKNYLHLTKQVNVWDSKTETTILKDIPNLPTWAVSLIHAYDAQALHLAMVRFEEELKNDPEFQKSNTLTIHDAVIINPKLAHRFKEIYNQALFELNNKYDKQVISFGSFMLNINKMRYSRLYSKLKKEYNDENPYKKNSDAYNEANEYTKKRMEEIDSRLSKFIEHTIFEKAEKKWVEADKYAKNAKEIEEAFQEFVKNKDMKSGNNNYFKNEFKDFVKKEIFNKKRKELAEGYNNQIKNEIKKILTSEPNVEDFENQGFESKEEAELYLKIKNNRDKLIEQHKEKLETDPKKFMQMSGKVFGDPLIEYTHEVEQETSKEPNRGFRKILHKKTLEAYQNILNSEQNKISDIIKNILGDQTEASDKNGIDLNKLQNLDKIVKYLNENGNGFYDNKKAIEELKKYMFVEPNKVIKFNSESNMSINQNKDPNYDQVKGLAHKLLYLHTLNTIHNNINNKSELSEEEIDKHVDNLHEFAKTHTAQEVIDKINEDTSICKN